MLLIGECLLKGARDYFIRSSLVQSLSAELACHGGAAFSLQLAYCNLPESLDDLSSARLQVTGLTPQHHCSIFLEFGLRRIGGNPTKKTCPFGPD